MIIVLVSGYLGAFTVGWALASLVGARARRSLRTLRRDQRAHRAQLERVLQRTEATVSELLALRAQLRRWPAR